MERGAKSAKAKVAARPSVPKKSRKAEASTRPAARTAPRGSIGTARRDQRDSPQLSRASPERCEAGAGDRRGAGRASVRCDVCASVARRRECASPNRRRIGPIRGRSGARYSRGVKRTWPVTRRIMSGRAVSTARPFTTPTSCLLLDCGSWSCRSAPASGSSVNDRGCAETSNVRDRAIAARAEVFGRATAASCATAARD